MAFLPILDVLGKIVDNVIPDPDKKMEMKVELAKLADQEAARESTERIAQTEVNKVEAGHSSLFVAGWRPAVGWTCVAGFGYNIILAPATGLPTADAALLRDVLLGMLGISYLGRTVEKIKGVAENTLLGPQPVGQPNEPIALPAKKKKGLEKLWPF